MGKLSEILEKSGDPVEQPPFTDQSSEKRSAPVFVQEEKSANTHVAAKVNAANKENWDERLIDASQKFSVVAESIRKVRAKILHPENGEEIRSILVTSSSQQEGKSFICANLGIGIAQSIEKHALMVDCDLRRPSLQTLFGLQSDRGLSTYLRNEEIIPNLILRTGLDRLSLISAGDIPDNPSELLSADKMAAMHREMTSRYQDRIVILDTPPFHAASETLVLSQMVDKVVIVVRWGKSSPHDVAKMVEAIGKEKILGVVFNAVQTNIIDNKFQGLSYQNYYSGSYHS